MLKGKFFDYIHQRLSNVTLPDKEMLEAAFDKAVEAHSKLEPFIQVVDFDGDGSTYEWTLASDFLEMSTIRSVEYPQGEQIPTILLPEKFMVYKDLSGSTIVKKFRLKEATPATGEVVRVTYTTMYTINDSESNLPTERDQALCDRGASILASMLSSEYARTQSSTLEADVVNNLAKIDHYINLSRHYLFKYKEAMGMKPEDIVPAAQGVQDFDVSVFQDKYAYLTH